MKNLIVLIFIGLMISSCGSTNEPEIQKQEVLDSKSVQKKRPEGKKRLRLNPEQIVAQLGLSEEKEVEFLTMWNSTEESLIAVRQEHRGNPDALREGMTAVKKERDDGLKRILSEYELSKFYQIMQDNRGKIGDPQVRRGNRN